MADCTMQSPACFRRRFVLIVGFTAAICMQQSINQSIIIIGRRYVCVRVYTVFLIKTPPVVNEENDKENQISNATEPKLPKAFRGHFPKPQARCRGTPSAPG
jgi:hypothetical protein